MKPLYLFTLTAALLLCLAPALVAQSVYTPWRHATPNGGASGLKQGFCERNEIMVGIFGHAGTLIDSVNGVLCVPIMADGKWAAPTPRRKLFDDYRRGGDPFTLQCPEGQAVRGLAGRSGTPDEKFPTDKYIDALSLLCGRLGQNEQGRVVITSEGESTTSVGGTGGTEFSDACPDGKLAWDITPKHNYGTQLRNVLSAIRLGCIEGSGRAYDVESLTLVPESVVPGQSATLTITLKGPAGFEDKRAINYPPQFLPNPIHLTADPGWEIPIPPGERTATVTITALPAADSRIRIDLKPTSRTHSTESPQKTLVVKDNGVKSLEPGKAARPGKSAVAANVNRLPTTMGRAVANADKVTMTVELEGPAGEGGVNVEVSVRRGDDLVEVPETVQVAEGESSATFVITKKAPTGEAEIQALVRPPRGPFAKSYTLRW